MHALIEHVERALPQGLIAVLFAVAHNTAVYLVDLFESAVFHEGGEDFASNTAGAVGDDGLIFQIVILTGFDLTNKVVGGANIGHHGVLELTDFGLECVTSVEEDDFIAAFFHELVHLFGFEVHAAADHAVFVYFELVGSAERHDFISCFDRQTGEVFGTAFRPFEFHVLEAGVLAGFFGVRLNRADFAAERAVNAVFGNEDAPAQTELLAQGTLPEHDRHGVGYGGKLVIQDNSILSHPPILRFLGTSCVP